MIPKIIHYCWFGGNPLPDTASKCIESWKKHCPDYEIKQWDETNVKILEMPLYVRQAYDAKKWAFVTDYVRLKVVYDCGGIYFDTDVELVRRPDELLTNHAYFGFEDGRYIATGLGFGAEKGASILQAMMQDYQNIPFLKEDGTYDLKPCPQRNTHVFSDYGAEMNGEMQKLPGNILLLPSEYLCPLSYETMHMHRTRKTISIHWFSASWKTQEQIAQEYNRRKQQIKRKRINAIRYFPKKAARFCLGNENYEKIKQFLKNKVRQ